MLDLFTEPKSDFWDDAHEQFLSFPAQHLIMEHSLLSLSKWESHWRTPFLDTGEKTVTQWVDYFKCMTINLASIDPMSYYTFSEAEYNKIVNYIATPQTATTFAEDAIRHPATGRHVETSETIYYSMAALGIPFECEKWHLSRLLALIRIGAIRSRGNDERKMSKADQSQMYAELNARRRQQYHTSG